MIYIKDDFLTTEEFKNIKDVLLSENFPWFYNDYRTHKGDNDLQFVHCFYNNELTSN